MKNVTISGVILGHKNLGECDKIVFLYNDDYGKIKAIAKGARKLTSRFTGHLETLNFCTAVLYFGPKNIILQEISTLTCPFRSRKSLPVISNALKMAQITNQLLYENQTLENLTELLKTAIKHLTASHKKSLITTSYTIKLLDKSGLIPDFKETQLHAETKYSKFFNFIKIKPFREIEKITLTKEEKSYVKKFTETLLQSS
ncbi:MAG: DNA repair protein RecO [Candidatus Peregrinibacteria bacterium]